jgi:hypothetical protein
MKNQSSNVQAWLIIAGNRKKFWHLNFDQINHFITPLDKLPEL